MDRFNWLTVITPILVSVCMITSPSVSLAQSYLQPPDTIDIFEPATENSFLPGARAAAMGGASIAAGTDGSVLWYNPALLTRIRSVELSATLSHQRLTDKTSIFGNATPQSNLNNTRLGGAWAIFSLPTVRGGLSLGASVNRVNSFDRIFRFASSQGWFNNPTTTPGWGGGEDETGNLWAWSFGGGIEVAPNMSVGVSLDIFDGSDEYSNFFDSTAAGNFLHYSQSINSNYTGVSGKAGFSYNATNWLSIGGVVGFPQSNSVDQNVTGTSTDNFTASYRYTLPFWFGLGAMANYRNFTFTGDVTYKDYSQLQYKRGQSDLAYANQLVMKYYKGTSNYHFGAEYVFQPSNISLRAGYDFEPIPFKGFPVSSDPHYLTFGAGFLLEKMISIDLAFLTGSFERTDYTKSQYATGSGDILPLPVLAKYNINRFMATVAYRF